MSNRVLLIGGNGFIGSHLCDALLEKNWAVRILDCCDERFRPPSPDVEYIKGDYSDMQIVKKAVSGCRVVYHLAHVGTPATSIHHADKEVLESIGAFVRVLEWLRGGVVERFVFFSSGGAVYGAPKMNPVNEEYKGWPVSSYGVAKLSMEHYLHMFSAMKNLPYQIIRPSNPYGPRQNFMGTQGVIPIFIYRIMQGLPVEVWGDGLKKKDYIFIHDLISAVMYLLESDVVNETFNIGSGVGYSLNEIISGIEALSINQARVNYREQKFQDVSEIVLSCEKIKSLCDWDIKYSLEKGIALTYQWVGGEVSRAG